MYVLEDKFDGMYRNRLPSLPGAIIREHIRSVDIRQTFTVAGRMDIHSVTMDGREILVQTTGDMTIADIVNKICEEYGK